MSAGCQAPVRTRGGVMRCVLTRAGCDYPSHRRWDPVAPAIEVVWRFKPWWPNRLGRAQDRGLAHTCPTLVRCRACAAGIPMDAYTGPGPLQRLLGLAQSVRDYIHPPQHRCGDDTCTEAHP